MKKYEKLKADENNAIRHHKEPEHQYRSKFNRDRDRIIYSKEFRRLNGKTQVFNSGFDDNVRNRFTHTIEVSQIAHTISAILGFDTTLSVAISLGHDVGHTPFGHIGERTLNFILNGCDVLNNTYKLADNNLGFKHNWQGLRVVSDLEQYSPKFNGINLTDYTLWGILIHSNLDHKLCKHSSDDYKYIGKTKTNKKIKICNLRNKRIPCINKNSSLSLSFYEQYNKLIREESWTFEGLVVRIADEIAQRNHDIEDSIKTDIITKDEFITKIEECFKGHLQPFEMLIKEIKKEKNKTFYLPLISRFIVDFLVSNLVQSSKINLDFILQTFKIKKKGDFENNKILIKKYYKENLFKSVISYSNDFADCEDKLQKFIWNRILNSHVTQSMDGKASYIIRNLVKAYLANPMQLPDQTIINLYKNNIYTKDEWKKCSSLKKNELAGFLRDDLRKDYFELDSSIVKNSLLRTICDFIAGMTDNYAIYQYELLYGTGEPFRNY